VEGERWRVKEGVEGGRLRKVSMNTHTNTRPHPTRACVHACTDHACMRAPTVLSGAVEAEDPQLAGWQPGEHGGGPGCHCRNSPSDRAKIGSQAPCNRLDCGDFPVCNVGTERYRASTRALSHCSKRIISLSSCHHTALSSRARWRMMYVAGNDARHHRAGVVRVMWFCERGRTATTT
jgi:hypothetical protein